MASFLLRRFAKTNKIGERRLQYPRRNNETPKARPLILSVTLNSHPIIFSQLHVHHYAVHADLGGAVLWRPSHAVAWSESPLHAGYTRCNIDDGGPRWLVEQLTECVNHYRHRGDVHTENSVKWCSSCVETVFIATPFKMACIAYMQELWPACSIW